MADDTPDPQAEAVLAAWTAAVTARFTCKTCDGVRLHYLIKVGVLDDKQVGRIGNRLSTWGCLSCNTEALLRINLRQMFNNKRSEEQRRTDAEEKSRRNRLYRKDRKRDKHR